MTVETRLSKKQKVLDAAVNLFRHTHNVKKVSLEAIAEAAGVSPTTVYNNFSNREKLLEEVITVLVEETVRRNWELIRSNIPFPRKISGLISGKLDLVSGVDRELLEKMVAQDNSVSSIFDRIYETEIIPLWKEMLADGKRQGYVDSSLNDEALLLYLDALKTGFSARRDILEKYLDNPVLIEQLTGIMFYGFLTRKIDLFGKEVK